MEGVCQRVGAGWAPRRPSATPRAEGACQRVGAGRGERQSPSPLPAPVLRFVTNCGSVRAVCSKAALFAVLATEIRKELRVCAKPRGKKRSSAQTVSAERGRLAVIRKFLGKRANACPLNVYFDIFLGNCDRERGLATARGGGYRLLQMTGLCKAGALPRTAECSKRPIPVKRGAAENGGLQ